MITKHLDYDAVFLDFDGVVVESSMIKTKAFYELYLPYGRDIAEKAMEYHINHQGINRYQKFEAIHSLLLDKQITENEKSELSRSFSNLVMDAILIAPFVEGVLSFLEQMKKDNIPVFLLSATPHDELIEICKKREITSYFKGIFGSPYEKAKKGEELIQIFNVNREKSIFVGDSLSDFKAASIIRMPFIGRIIAGEPDPFSDTISKIKNFTELLK